mgnify:CR=1 FL=1
MPKSTFLNLRPEKRADFTDAALFEFALNDYQNASITNMVKVLGIAKGSVYQYFENKKDLYEFDKFTDKLLAADCYEVKIIEDFSELDPANVSDEIIEKTEDTMTLLENYIDELDVTLDKERLKGTMRSLYTEAQDIEV